MKLKIALFACLGMILPLAISAQSNDDPITITNAITSAATRVVEAEAGHQDQACCSLSDALRCCLLCNHYENLRRDDLAVDLGIR